jgi:hypothetical protein
MQNNDLFPEIIVTKIPIVTIHHTGSKYGTVAVSASGNLYSFRSITQEPYFERIKQVGFEEPCKKYESHPDLPYICGTGVRDYQIVDLNQESIFKSIVSCNGNEEFFLHYVFKGVKPIILLLLEHVGWNENDSYEETYLFDFEKKSPVKILDNYYGSQFFQLDENLLLRGEMQRGSLPYIWQTMNSDFNKKMSNDLTDTLNHINIQTFKQSYNKKGRMMICYTRDSSYTNCTISWDSAYKKVNVVPWTFQEPKEIISGKDFCFSPDGTWLRNTSCYRSNLDTDFNVFYHISDKYPASVSIPIFGIESVVGVPGAFLDTPEWGTVFVDLSRGLEGILMVYKMRDVMAKIVERAVEMR